METWQNQLQNLISKGWKALGIMAFAFILVFSMTACSDGGSSTADAGEATEETETTETETSGDSFSMTPEEIEALKAKFTVNASGYYNHNYWGERVPPRRTLKAIVNQTGYYYVSSVYYGEKAPSHTRVIVKVGDQSITSNRAASKDRQTQTDGSKKYEINNYTNYGDNGIFEAIGKSAEGTEVNIRFDGPDSYSDAPMSDNDIIAMRECYHMSLVLRMEAATGGAN